MNSLTEGLSRAESFFVQTYIIKNKRERFLYELSSPKRRSSCIWRFAHRARDFLVPESINCAKYTQGKLIMGLNNLLDCFGEDEVYILHFDSSEDKKRMKFKDAIDYFIGGGPYIMISCNLKWGFIETESDCESHEYIVLHPLAHQQMSVPD